MQFQIRDSALDDVARLREVFRRSSLANKGDRAALIAHPEALDYSATSLTQTRVRVATIEQNLIVGFASTAPEEGFLELVDLFTDPDWMRRGVATALIRDVISFAIASDLGQIAVVANPHALDF